MNNDNYVYFVEGECEESLINCLKHDFRYIRSGKVIVYNVLQKSIKNKLISIKPNTNLVFVFDTDKDDLSKSMLKFLHTNLEYADKSKHVKKIYLIPQVSNFEDELIYSTSITKIINFTKSKTNSNFKKDFLDLKDLKSTLLKNNFQIEKLWSKLPQNNFSQYRNNPNKPIKKITINTTKNDSKYIKILNK